MSPFLSFLIIANVIYFGLILVLVHLKGDTSIANPAWIVAVMFNGIYSLWFAHNYYARPLLLTGLTIVWAARLVLYSYWRYTGNDPRYQTWKKSGLKALIFNLVYIFGGQLFMTAVMSIPAVTVNLTSGPGLKILDFIGLLIWLVGFYFESVSDHQLFIFMKELSNQGRVMRYGLWKYSRHPNYFGEIVMWWAVFLIALSTPYGIYTIIAPITITISLLFVTGVVWVERVFDNNPEYQEYKKRTSMLIPWCVKK